MEQEDCRKSLKRLVAQAVLFGMELSERPLEGAIWEPQNGQLWSGMEKLHERAAEFLELSLINDISADQVLPLHREIESIVKRGG